MSLTIWSYIFGGATLFGLIVGIFSVWNGRMIRREIGQLIASEAEHTRKLIEQISARTQTLLETNTQILERNTAVLERLAAR